MRVVIVGATGNMGTALVRALRVAGDVEVVGLARRAPGTEEGATYRAVDIVADDLGPHFRGADAVVHLAWLFQPTHRPELTWATNVGGAERVFRAAGEAGVGTVVYASSVGAYSPAPREAIVDERWPTHSLPTSAYGREKAYVERLLDRFEAEHPDARVVRVRPGFVFQRSSGAQQRRLFAGPYVPRRLVRPGRPPFLPWPSGLRLQAVHADDLATAYRAVLTSDVAGAFNIAAEPLIDRTVIGEALEARTVEVPPSVVRAALSAAWHARAVPAEPGLLDLVLSLPVMRVDRARQELGWRPARSAVDALREALEGMAAGEGAGEGPLAGDTLGRRSPLSGTGRPRWS